MFKYIKYMFAFISFFLIFNMNVEAKKKKNKENYVSGDCIYNIQYKKKYYNVKINQTKDGKITYYYNLGKKKINNVNDSGWSANDGKSSFKNNTKDSFWVKKHYSKCPSYALLKVGKNKNVTFYFSNASSAQGYKASVAVSLMPTIGDSGTASGTGNTAGGNSATHSVTILDGTNKSSITKCEDILTKDLSEMLKNIVTFIKVLVPLLLIVFGIIDFGGAVFAGDEEKMKKSQNKFIRRLIIGAVIFMIPNVLKVVLSIAHRIWPVIDASLCGVI